MNKKITCIFLTLALIITIFVITPNDLNVKASEKDTYEAPSIDYPFTKYISNELSIIVNKTQDYNIDKGRFFGTEGEQEAADIIEDWMIINCSLGTVNVTKEPIENIPYKNQILDYSLGLTTKLEILDKNITITNLTSNNSLQVSDCYISPRWNTSLFKWYDRDLLNHTFIEENLTIYLPPSDGSYFGPSNLSWMSDFLLDDNTTDLIQKDFLKYTPSITDYNNLINILRPAFQNYYNFNFENESDPPDGFVAFTDPSEDYVLIEENPVMNPDKKTPAWEPEYLLKWNYEPFENLTKGLFDSLHKWTYMIHKEIWYIYNDNCKGIIRYDFNNETYDMNLHRFDPIPTLYINGTIGKEIYSDPENFTINYTLNQRYNQSVESYNVIGQINGTDTDKAVIVSCLYDSWWNQGTADSAIGMGILLVIAKYMKELQEEGIKPKYTVKFVAFSGEEYGRVGARYYDAKHSENIIALIDLNQLGFDQPPSNLNLSDLELQIWTNKPLCHFYNKNIEEIVEKTDYTGIVGLNCTVKNRIDGGPIGNKDPFALNSSRKIKDRIKTIYFVKNKKWIFHHRDGMNHTIGDTMSYYNETDVKATTDIIWNITKYFTINPDCWFENVTVNLSDSPLDDNTKNDSGNISFTVHTIMPVNETVTVGLVIRSVHRPLVWDYYEDTYSVNNSSHVKGKFDFHINNTVKFLPDDNYTLKLVLLNSTGEIKRFPFIVLSADFYADDIKTFCIDLSPINDNPETPVIRSGPSQIIKAGTEYTFTANTTDPDNDTVYYQWAWKYNKKSGGYSILDGPYDSSKICTATHKWLCPFGDIEVRVRAKDALLSPNSWSNWSDPWNLTINPGCAITLSSDCVVINKTSMLTNNVYGGNKPYNMTLEIHDNGTKGQQEATYKNNGTNYTLWTQNHTFNNTNETVYSAKLTITDDDGLNVTFWFEFDGKFVNAEFTTSSTGAQPDESINFNDISISTNEISNWSWDFGDGNCSYLQNTSHSYDSTGVYTVNFTVTDDEGNNDTASRIIHIETTKPDIVSIYHTSDVVEFPGSSITIYTDFLENQSG